MPGKEETLNYIKTLVAQQLISREEVMAAYDAGRGIKTESLLTKKLGVTAVLNYIGGTIILMGIFILVWQNWDTLNVNLKILATLGSGLVAYIAGILFGKGGKFEAVGFAFHLIAAFITPLGLYVVFDSLGYNAGSYGFQSIISSVLFGGYLLLYALLRKIFFVFFAIIFGTWLFFASTSFWVVRNPIFFKDFFEYQVLVSGLVYVFLGFVFSKAEKAPMSGFLYGFWIFGFLGAALALGGWKPEQKVFWEFFFPGLAFATLYLSVFLKSKAFLVFGTLYLLSFILKMTLEYFTSSLGWPLSLVLGGFMFIIVGYISLRIKNKCISRTT